MISEFVLDCSVTMTWFFVHEAASETDKLLAAIGGTGRAIVPQHWRIELGNVLLVAERRKEKSPTDSTQFVGLLQCLNITIDEETTAHALGRAISLARDHKLTLYDACYLELALRRGIPLASLDGDLRSAAKKVGVMCLPKQI